MPSHVSITYLERDLRLQQIQLAPISLWSSIKKRLNIRVNWCTFDLHWNKSKMTHSNEKSLIIDERVILSLNSVWRKRMKGLNKKNKLSKHNKTLWDDNTKKGIRRGVCLMEERIQRTGDSHFWTRWRRCILHLRKAGFKRTRCSAHTSYWVIIKHQALPVALTSTSHDYVPPLGTEESSVGAFNAKTELK